MTDQDTLLVNLLEEGKDALRAALDAIERGENRTMVALDYCARMEMLLQWAGRKMTVN